MIADALTKPLYRQKHEEFVDKISLQSLAKRGSVCIQSYKSDKKSSAQTIGTDQVDSRPSALEATVDVVSTVVTCRLGDCSGNGFIKQSFCESHNSISNDILNLISLNNMLYPFCTNCNNLFLVLVRKLDLFI
jgi:hypothetical protein